MRELQIRFYLFLPGEEPAAWRSMLRMCNTAHGPFLLPGAAQKMVEKERKLIISYALPVSPAESYF